MEIDLSKIFPEKKDAFAVVIDNVFSEEECKELISRSETVGYSEALVGYDQVRVVEQRNNWRCMIDDPEFADVIFQRIKDYIPPEWLGKKVSRLNERLRFLKYNPGEYFKPHNDGKFLKYDKSEISYITVQVYLNDVTYGHGGETTFTTEKLSYGIYAKSKQTNAVKRFSVPPVTGRVLIFEHDLPHEGSKLLEGYKYAIRTDVMYTIELGDSVSRKNRWYTEYPHPQYSRPVALQK